MNLADLKNNGSRFYDLLVQTPLEDRLHWHYTWNLFTSHFANNDGLTCLRAWVSSGDVFTLSYRQNDPFSEALLFVSAITVIHYLVSVVTNNYSQVGKQGCR